FRSASPSNDKVRGEGLVKTSLTICPFSVLECKNSNYTVKRCKSTDRCITDWMACNGQNDCGDWTDEMYCKGAKPPVPPAPIVQGGGGMVLCVCVCVRPCPLVSLCV